MQAILCRFIGPTNTKPSRWVVSAGPGRKTYPASGETEKPRDAVRRYLREHAETMAKEYGTGDPSKHHWGKFTLGQLLDGNYVATLDTTRRFNPELCG